MRKTRTWILVADGSRARILVNEGPGKGLKPAYEHEFATSHAPDRAFVTDRPGRNRNGASGRTHRIESQVRWHRFEKEVFARSMASVVNEAAGRNAFDRLVLVAPPSALGALRRELNETARASCTLEVGKNLTHIPVASLPRHLGGAMLL